MLKTKLNALFRLEIPKSNHTPLFGQNNETFCGQQSIIEEYKLSVAGNQLYYY